MKDLLYENGQISKTRCLAVSSYVLFIVVTVFMVITGREWQHYEAFAAMTAGGGLVTQAANKLINSKYNSTTGQFPQKQGGL